MAGKRLILHSIFFVSFADYRGIIGCVHCRSHRIGASQSYLAVGNYSERSALPAGGPQGLN